MGDKKQVEQITSMEVDFAQWYTDVVQTRGLCDLGADPEADG